MYFNRPGFTSRLSFFNWRALVLLCMVMVAVAPSRATAGFPIRYDGTLTVLANGSVTHPQGVAVDLSGNVYIADTGGARIIKVTAAGSAAPLAISGPTLIRPMGLATDSSGNLYIADAGTAPSGVNSQVVMVTPAGSGTVISTASFTLSGAQGVTVDPTGDVFVTDTNNNRIIEVAAGGTASVVSTSSGVALTSLSSPEGIAVDIFGNLYIVDTGNNRVVKVTTAHVGSSVSVSGTLNAPVAVGVGMNGVVYIVDGPTNDRIAVNTPQGDTYDLFFDEINSEFGTPSAIAISPGGTVYVADYAGGKVNAFQVDTAGFGSVAVGTSGTPVTLNFIVNTTATVTAIAIDTAGTQNLDFTIAANSGTPCVVGSATVTCTVNVQFTPTSAGLRRGALVLSYSDTSFGTGSLAVPLFGYGDAPVAALSPGVASVVNVGTVVSVGEPFQTAEDGAGNIYVTSYLNSNVLKIPAGGGTGSLVTIPALPAPTGLSNPTGLAIDGGGNLFISDYEHSRLVEVTPAGTSKVIVIGGLSTGISLPTALSFTGNGRLLVNDYGNGRIVMLSPNIYDAGNNDGDGTVGKSTGYVLPQGAYTIGVDNSTGIAADAQGNVYYPDETNNRVIKLDPHGKLTIVSLPAITLSGPLGVAVDPSQNLYVMDSGNERVIQQTVTDGTSVMKYTGPSVGQFIFGLEVDGSGNVLLADFVNNRLVLDNVGHSALTFPSTAERAMSTRQTTTLTNLGDQPLVLAANPTYTVNFIEDTTDTNPCTSATSLTTGTSCDVPVIFSPQSAGSLSANITVSDNMFNSPGSTQQIAVSGTSTNPGDSTTTIQTNPAATSYNYGQPITVSVQVKDVTNTSTIPTGSVTFTDSLTSTTTQVTLDSAGNAVLLNNNELSGIGAHSITASYPGVSGQFLSSSTTLQITINQDSVTVSGPTQVSLSTGQTGSATITVAPSLTNGAFAAAAALPSGTISFSIVSGSTTVVSPTTVALSAGTANSTATVAIPGTLAAGTYSIEVSYAGDSNYQAATAVTVPLTVATVVTPPSAGFSISASPSEVSVDAGRTGQTTVTFNPVGGFTGTVTLSCGNLPAKASCAFSPQSFVATGSNQAQTAQLTIASFPTAGDLEPRELHASKAITLWASLLLLPGWALGGGVGWRGRRSGRLTRYGFVLLGALAVLSLLNGCSNYHPTDPDTRLGSYVVTVTATASATATGYSGPTQQSAQVTFQVL